MRGKLNEIIVKHTGQSLKKVKQDTDRDYIMTATEAREYGIIDKLMEPRPAKETIRSAT